MPYLWQYSVVCFEPSCNWMSPLGIHILNPRCSANSLTFDTRSSLCPNDAGLSYSSISILRLSRSYVQHIFCLGTIGYELTIMFLCGISAIVLACGGSVGLTNSFCVSCCNYCMLGLKMLGTNIGMVLVWEYSSLTYLFFCSCSLIGSFLTLTSSDF